MDSDEEINNSRGSKLPNKTASSRGSAKVTSGGHTKQQHSGSVNDEAKSKDVNANKAQIDDRTPIPKQSEVMAFFSSKQKCCSRGTDSHCCLETYFFCKNENASDDEDLGKTVDTTKLYSFIVAMRKLTRNKSKAELDQHIISEVRKCIQDVQERKPSHAVTDYSAAKSSTSQFRYNWNLGFLNGLNFVGPYTVCREIFAYAWGVSVRQVKSAADAIRGSEYGFVHGSKLRKLNDKSRYYEEYSYDDVERIMSENVVLNNEIGTFSIGKKQPCAASDNYILLFYSLFIIVLQFIIVIHSLTLATRSRFNTRRSDSNVRIRSLLY
jgi:hypothetical protein